MYLCETLEIMCANKLMHGHLDIFDNVVIQTTSTNTCPQIADISFTFDDLVAKRYDFTNVFIPLECHLLQYMTTRGLQSISEQNVDDLVYDVYAHHSLFDPVVAAEYGIKAHHYLNSFINASRDQIVKQVRKASETWDQFGLCANYMKVFLSVTSSTNYKKQIQMCIKMFMEEMHPNPGKRRRTASDLKTTMKKIFCCKRV